MSIQSEIERIKMNIASAYTVLIQKGASQPAVKNSVNLASTIQSISLGTDTSDATAVSGDILSGKTAYANGSKLTGTLVLAKAPIITPPVKRQKEYNSIIFSLLEPVAQEEIDSILIWSVPTSFDTGYGREQYVNPSTYPSYSVDAISILPSKNTAYYSGEMHENQTARSGYYESSPMAYATSLTDSGFGNGYTLVVLTSETLTIRFGAYTGRNYYTMNSNYIYYHCIILRK